MAVPRPEPRGYPGNLGAPFSAHAGSTRSALVDLRDAMSAREHSFADLDTQADAVARGLVRRGLKAGDRICILALNREEFVTTLLGAMRAGVIPVPVNIKLAAETVRYIATDAGARLAFCESAYRYLLPADLPVVSFDGDHPFTAFLDHGPFSPVEPGPESVAIQPYTSVQHIANLNADLYCLQEVEPETFVALRTFLGERGNSGEYARKLSGRPEGLAIFFRRASFDWISSRVVAYADGAGVAHDTGYIAQLIMMRNGDKTLGVINTHLTWDPPNSAREARRGLRQVQQCLAEYQNSAGEAGAWIISGDFNATPESEIVTLALQAGLEYSHYHLADVFTCNIGGSARLIDYLFYSRELSAEPSVLSRIDAQTLLPSAEQPSDHVAKLFGLNPTNGAVDLPVGRGHFIGVPDRHVNLQLVRPVLLGGSSPATTSSTGVVTRSARPAES